MKLTTRDNDYFLVIEIRFSIRSLSPPHLAQKPITFAEQARKLSTKDLYGDNLIDHDLGSLDRDFGIVKEISIITTGFIDAERMVGIHVTNRESRVQIKIHMCTLCMICNLSQIHGDQFVCKLRISVTIYNVVSIMKHQCEG